MIFASCIQPAIPCAESINYQCKKNCRATLPVIGISPFWQMAISGAVIVIAVLLNERSNKTHGRLILRNAALARQKQAVKS